MKPNTNLGKRCQMIAGDVFPSCPRLQRQSKNAKRKAPHQSVHFCVALTILAIFCACLAVNCASAYNGSGWCQCWPPKNAPATASGIFKAPAPAAK